MGEPKPPTPKHKHGAYVWYVRDGENIFKRAYVCDWKIVIWSHGHSQIFYTVEYYDPNSDDYEENDSTDYDVPEHLLFDNELDARRKQLELWGSEHTRQRSAMESLDKLRAKIMQRIRDLESKQGDNK